MSEFNGQNFHGYPVENDAELSASTWNTKNFEFSCIRPEVVQRAIDKVQSDVGASLKQRKSLLLSKLREKGGETPVFNNWYNRDMDIETHLSQDHCADQERTYGSENSPLSPHQFFSYLPREVPPSAKPHPNEQNEQMLKKKIPPPPPGFELRPGSSSSLRTTTKLQRVAIEEYPEPKWVSIEEPQLQTMQIYDSRDMQACMMSPMTEHMAYPDIYTDRDPRAYVIDSDLDDEMQQRPHYVQFCQQRPKPDDMQASDDNESRPEFVKIAPKEPYTDMSQLKSTAPMRYSELSDMEAQHESRDESPRVVIKKRVDTMSDSMKVEQAKTKLKKEKILAKKTLANLIAEEKMLSSNQQRRVMPKVQFRRQRKQNASPNSTQRQNVHSPSTVMHQLQQQQQHQHQHPKPRAANQSRQKPAQTASLLPSAPPKPQIILPSGKSIEQLKSEKAAIFNKMSRTHERIVLALETLREKLLEVHEPESTSDRNRRNRNGFEFSVRFLRNFLYPLKGMIDTMRNTTKEQFNSATSNEACNRVSHIYSLFLQAILTYSKQLRHFMIDQVPQKLTTLLEMLFSTLNICLDKRLFDQNDPLVDCLLDHCKNFLHFMEDLHARRFVAARESYRKASDSHESKFNLKMFMNDLNMYEPRLVPKKVSQMRIKGGNSVKSGYSTLPAISAVKATLPMPRNRRGKGSVHIRRNRHEAERLIEDSSAEVMHKRLEADVRTQMQECAQMRSSELDFHQRDNVINLQKILQNSHDIDRNDKIEVINRAIVEALQSVEHGQATEVLKPLLETINAALDLPDNVECIERFLKAIAMKISMPANERRKMCCYEVRSGGYCLAQNANRTKPASSHTSMAQQQPGHNGDDLNSQQQQQQQHDKRCSGDHNDTHDGDDEDDANVNANHVRNDSGEDQSDYESPYNDENDDNDENCLNAGINCQTKINDQSEEYDEDAQFYVSGTNLEACNNKRYEFSNQCRKKLQPLVECATGDHECNKEADGKSNNSNILSTKKKSKRSPYELKMRRKLSTHSITTPTIIPQTKKSAASAAAAKRTLHHTTIPPSPAMARLRQRLQPPLPISDRSKRNAGASGATANNTTNIISAASLLKKHSRRNPMGLPPPAPTVSPSTSGPNTPSINASELRISVSSTAMSHKGVSTKDHNAIAVKAKLAGNAKRQNSKNCIHDGVAGINNDADDGDYDDGEATFRADKTQFTEVSRSASKKEIQSYSDGNAKGVELPLSETNCCASSQSPLTLYTGSNPYGLLKKRQTPSPSSSFHKQEKYSDHSDEQNRIRAKVTFDESNLLLERDQHLSLCLRNPLYSNPKFSRPWKMFTRLSEKLTEEVLNAVQSDFANGVEAFIDDFLHLETTI